MNQSTRFGYNNRDNLIGVTEPIDLPNEGSLYYNHYRWSEPDTISWPGGSRRQISYTADLKPTRLLDQKNRGQTTVLLTEIQDEWTGPAAPGERIPLPPPDKQWVQSHIEPYRFSWDALLLPGWWIIKGYFKRWLYRALALHRMDAVLESLNRQAEALGCEQGYATGGGF